MHFLHLKILPRDYKTSDAITFVSFVMIMEENFKMKNSVVLVKNLVFSIIFLLLELPNKMGLWKRISGLMKNLL